MENKKTLTAADLEQFIGSEHYYKHWTNIIQYTDGVAYMAKAGGAYWLIDAIASYQGEKHFELDELQLWELVKSDDGDSAVLTARRDTGLPPVIKQEIEYTDFPLQEIKLYVKNGILFLPSEY